MHHRIARIAAAISLGATLLGPAVVSHAQSTTSASVTCTLSPALVTPYGTVTTIKLTQSQYQLLTAAPSGATLQIGSYTITKIDATTFTLTFNGVTTTYTLTCAR